MRASSPGLGANSIVSSRRNVLLGCTECAVRALSEKVRGGCVHSPSRRGRVWAGSGMFKPCRHCELFEFHLDHSEREFRYTKLGKVVMVMSLLKSLHKSLYKNAKDPTLSILGHHGGRRKVASLRPPFSTPATPRDKPEPAGPFPSSIERAPPLFVRIPAG